MRKQAIAKGLLGSFACATLTAVGAVNYPPPPPTRKVEVVDTLHGVSIADPYRWLEDQESSETRAWLEAQNAYAETIVGESARRARLRSRFSELMRYDDPSPARKGGAWEYFTLRRPTQELPVICRRPAPPEGELRRIDPRSDCEVIFDPHPMSADHTLRVELLSVSPDGKLIAYGVRDGGQDELEIRLRDAAQGSDLPDRFPSGLYSGVAFNKAGSALYYSRRSRETGARVRVHELGTPVETDVELFGAGYGPTAFIDVREVADGRYLLFTVNHGWARSELHLKDLTKDTPVRAIVAGAEARFYPFFEAGRLYVRTNLDAPLNRLLAIDLENPAPDQWKGILPEASDVLHGAAVIDGRIYATYLHDVSARIRIFELDGTAAGEIAVPEHHSAELRAAVKGKAFLTLSSFHQPPVTYLVDLASGSREVWERRDVNFDGSEVQVQQVWCQSKDGTRVPMYLVHRRGLALKGENPALLYAYGGFYAALTPPWDVAAAVWVEQGGVFAMANLRGGSEFGEGWHRAGMLQNKQNVFDDFIAAAEWLVANRYTSPRRLAIRGTSNGGLLVASALTQRPDLFRAVLCGFPDLDMIRFYTFTRTNNLPALLEYGNGALREHFEFLRQYSPYQAVKDGTAYPAVMLTSGDRDTRVPPLQARKLTARLQAATSSGLPVILRYHPQAGHAAERGLPVSRNVEDAAMELAFLFAMLGVD